MSAKSIGLSDALHAYIVAHGVHEHPALTELRRVTAEHPMARMQISAEQGQFMRLLARLMGAKRYLEIGTFTGYSSLCMALEMGSDAQIVCCDVSEEFTNIARQFWAKADVEDRVALHLAPAVDTLDALIAQGVASFDIAFIDADKTSHLAYYERCLKLVRPGGLIVVDNSLWSGRVLDPQDPDDIAIDALNRFIHTDARVYPSLLPVGDGLMLAYKI